MTSLFDLTGRVAVITGSSRGIGRAIAERMAEHGAQVVISSRKAEACAQAADAINEASARKAAIAIAANISSKEELQRLVDEDRYCADILVQISSVQEALRSVGRALMRNHLRHCASEAIRDTAPGRAEAMYEELLSLMDMHSR